LSTDSSHVSAAAKAGIDATLSQSEQASNQPHPWVTDHGPGVDPFSFHASH
jgi:hypothetical protein